jgi:hypothetical protein
VACGVRGAATLHGHVPALHGYSHCTSPPFSLLARQSFRTPRLVPSSPSLRLLRAPKPVSHGNHSAALRAPRETTQTDIALQLWGSPADGSGADRAMPTGRRRSCDVCSTSRVAADGRLSTATAPIGGFRCALLRAGARGSCTVCWALRRSRGAGCVARVCDGYVLCTRRASAEGSVDSISRSGRLRPGGRVCWLPT